MPSQHRVLSALEESVDRSIRYSDRLALATGALDRYRITDSPLVRMNALLNVGAFDSALFARDRFAQLEGLVEPAWARSLRQMEQSHTLSKHLFEPSAIERAMKLAEASQALALPSALDRFRTDADLLSHRIALVQGADWWRDTSHIGAFTTASALSDAYADSNFVSAALRSAGQDFLAAKLPDLPTLADHRYFLDAAGLVLPRWPRLRRLTPSEKKRRFHAQLKANAESVHVRKARTLTHQYELVLRDAIDNVMTDAFGEEWWTKRLPLCGCGDLLKRWEARGGYVLDHADFPHYVRIMCHPEHHKAGFDIGFPDLLALEQLLADARKLRAASHHPRREPFTPQDLRALRVTWSEIKVGLIEMLPDHEFE